MKDILLAIDIQNAYKIGQPWGCPNIDAVISNTIKLLESDKFDTAFFTRHIPSPTPAGTWKKYNDHYDQINSSPHLSRLVPELLPHTKHHTVIEKSTYSAASALPAALFQVPLPRIVITGVVAHCCVLSTIMSLIDKGNEIVYLNDAIAGQHTDFEEMTRSIIKSFSPIHTHILTTAEYLNTTPA